MRIMIVEDELVSRKKLEKILRDLGTCTLIEDAQTAIAEYKSAWHRRKPYDLVTLDLEMYELGGNEVVYEIRGFERQQNIPEEKRCKIVIVTSHGEPESYRESAAAGCDAYLVKPFDRDSIMETLQFMGVTQRSEEGGQG